MESSATTETESEHLTVSACDASKGENPDPTCDFALGLTCVFLDSKKFLAYLDHCHQPAT